MAPSRQDDEVADDIEDIDNSRRLGPLPLLGNFLHWCSYSAPSHMGIFRLLLAAVLGVTTAYGALLFRYLIGAVSMLAFPGGASLSRLRALPWFRVMFPPAGGGLIVAPLVHWLAPEAKGHGVPEVKEACARRGGRIRPRVAVVKILASGITIGSGGSVGREGPIVQIGSALGSAFGQLFGLRGPNLIDFVAAGAAAGIAATFNAPIAGVIFAVEIIMGRSSPRHFSPLVVAAVIATVITHLHIGKNPAFLVPAYTLVSAWELLLYALLGLLAGLVGVSFTRGLYLLEDVWERVPVPPYLIGVVGGTCVGAMALQFPEVLGVGYELIEAVLGMSDERVMPFMGSMSGQLVLLMAIKVLATGTTIGSGGSGGVFAPSLFLGTCLGGAFGAAAGRLMPPGTVGPPAAYALVGMGGVVAATTHAPLTAILIVFELCNRHSIILPLMLTAVVSTMLAMGLFRESIYTLKLVRRGTRIDAGAAPQARISATEVREVMQPDATYVHPSARIELIVQRAHEGDTHDVYVVDAKRQVLGVVTMDDVAAHVEDRPVSRRKLRAHQLMHPVAAVPETASLSDAMSALAPRHQHQLPVIDVRGRLTGVLHRGDMLAYYNRELLRHEAVLDLAQDARHDPHREEIALDPDERPELIKVGPGLAGKTLKELDLRVRFGITVYAIRDERGRAKVPMPDEKLIEGETLVVVGPRAEVEHLTGLAQASPAED